MYEIHITVDVSKASIASQVARDYKWKTSEIARDPVLGNKNFFYLTKYKSTFFEAFETMQECIEALADLDVSILREKIEHIVHDIKHV